MCMAVESLITIMDIISHFITVWNSILSNF